jgi:hypothetical protein
MRQRTLLVTAWLLSFVNNVQSQWVQSGSLPSETQVLAISPDGSTIIASDGIYTLSKNVWTFTQSLTGLGTSIFLSYDGSVFASSFTSPNVDIFSSTTSPGTWKVSSTIYGYSLGLDSDTSLTISAATSDGKTLALVSSKCYNNATTSLCDRSIFILQSNVVGSNYVLAQQLTGLPKDSRLKYNRISMSADGSILAAFLSSEYCYAGPSQLPLAFVSVYSRGSDDLYSISEQNFGDYSNWSDLIISSKGQILTASLCDTQGKSVQYFTQVDGQYELLSTYIFWNGYEGNVPFLSTSSDSSVVFVSIYGFEYFIFQRLNQTSWLSVQTIVNSAGPKGVLPIFSSADGSTFLSGTVIYSGPSSQVSAAPSASPASSTLITATSTPTATSTSTRGGPSSISSSTLPQPATITISVLSTALTLISIALFVKWFSNYRTKLMLRADSSDRSEALLRVN